MDTASALRHALTAEAQRAAEGSSGAPQRQEVVFVDNRVQDYQQLISGLKPGTEVVVLDSSKDGLQQIADYLNGRSDLDAVHLISHGEAGKIQLGRDWLDSSTLDSRSETLARIGSALSTDGDIFLYGCNVGSSSVGQNFILNMAGKTGADIAASSNATGSAARGGDWVLETSTGSIEQSIVWKTPPTDYAGLLANGTLTFTSNSNVSGGVARDGQGGSSDLPGITLEIFNIQDTDGTRDTQPGSEIKWFDNSYLSSPQAGYTALTNELNAGSKGMAIKSSDGSPFQINGFTYYNWGETENATYTVKGYLNGAEVASQEFTVIYDKVRQASDVTTVSLGSAFDYVAEVRLYISAGGYLGDQSASNHSINNIQIADAVAPLPSATIAMSRAALKIGETSTVTFAFNMAVTGFTTADLTVPNGTITGLTSSDGGLTWTGLFTPNSSVTDSTNVITVNLAGVNAVSGGLAGVGTADSVNYSIDTAAPTVASVTSSIGNGTYKAGDVISVQVNFGESVTVSGTPQLTLETGSTDRTVNYASGSGTSILTFNYTVQAGDTAADLDYISTSALALNGGTIRDAAGNDAVLTLAAPGSAGSLGANKDIAINSAPSIGNLNGDSVAWAGAGNTVTLDSSANVTFNDTEFGALNGGNGDWAGAILSVQAVGGALSSDIFGFNTVGANFTISGSTLQSGGQTFATFTSTGGVLTITFTSSGTSATTALINDVVRHITYRSDTPAGDATIRFSLNDGSSTATANTTVTSDTIYITNTTDTGTIDRSNGVSFSEAVAIAAADGTGSQTLIFTSAFSSGMSLAGNLSIAESLTINADSASGLSINGSTITLGGGTTLNFTNATGTVTIASTLAGSGSLSKAGASGTLVLSSTSNEANMSGGITVTGGSLQISNDDQLSSGNLTLNGGTLTNNSTGFTIDNAIAIGASGGTINVGGGGGATQLTLSGVISGSGTLVKNGQAILQLDGNNTYTGDTSLVAGTLILNHANALGSTAGGTTVAAGTSVRVNGGLTVAEAFTVSGTGKTVSAVDYGALHLLSGSSTLSGNITFTGDSDISAASGSTLTLSGALGGGAYNLNKTGAGTLILSSAGNEAGLTGGTTITAGTLTVANDDHLAAGTITLNGGTLAITGATTIDNAITVASASTISATANATLSGALSGANALTKSGASTLTLAGASGGHFGALNITAGGVTLSGGSALGDSSLVTMSSGTTLTVSSAEAIGSLAGAGSVVLNGALTIGGDNGSATYTGVISGASGLTKVGSGTQTLTGANSYTGATSISAGGLAIGSGGALGNDSAVTVSSGATLTSNTASLAIGSFAGAGVVSFGANTFISGSNNSSTTFSGAISGSGTLGKAGSGTLTLSGTNSGSSAAILVNGGALAVASDANLTSGTVTLQNSNLRITGAGTIDNNIVLSGGSGGIVADAAATLSGVISGGGLLAKSGTGTLKLTGTNTYSGATNVASGSLIVDGALSATSGVVVSSSATLGGSGSIFASSSTNTLTVVNGGTLSPGNGGAGALTVNGNLVMNSGSTLALDISGTSAGNHYDQVIVNGTVDVTGATLAVTHAYAAGTGDSYSIIVNDAADAVTGTFSGLSEGSVVTAGGNSTPLTASYIAGTGNDFTLTAPTAPRVNDVSSSTANGTYKIGDTITVTITFDTTVDVTGTPKLQLETGDSDRTLSYVSGSGTTTLTFSYTVQAGDSSADLDYASTSALTLNGGTIKDGSSRDAILTLPAPGTAGSLGANKALVVDGVRPTASSISLSDTALKAGDTATVTITFAEAVTGLDASDFTVAGGTIGALSSADGGFTWTTTFTPTSNLTSGTNAITLNNTGVTDEAGNLGSGTTSSLNYTIDTQLPTATIDVANTALKAGQTTTVTITFSEAVSGLDTGDFTVSNGSLSSLSSSDGGITWTATFTPAAGITASTNLITLNNTGFADLSGNAGGGITNSNNYVIDTLRPTATIVLSDPTLSAGETSLVTITFSEAVTGFTLADLNASNGNLSNLSSSDGGITWTATFTPSVGINDATNLIILDNTGVADLSGNVGAGTTNSANFVINTVLPTATIVVSDSALKVGETSLVTITFSEAVTGFTNADLTIANGTLSAVSSADGGITWTATFTPTSNITDATNLITLDNTGVQNAHGNAGSGTTVSNNYAIDNQRPTATIVVADAALGVGQITTVTFTFSEAVTGFTLADVTVANGTLSGLTTSDNITWTATFTPAAGITDTSNLITLDNTGVADVAGNAGTGSTDSNNYVIDSQRPTATIVISDTDLRPGEAATVTITFSEAVTGFDNSDLSVVNGTLSNVSSSDGGITWTATFTPNIGVSDATNLIVLNNTGIADLAGNTGTGATNSANYAVQTLVPTATIVVADTALKAGDTSLVTITFSEAVSGFSNADLTIANGTLSAVSSADGGITWTATFTPTSNITDASNLVTLNNAGVTNASGNGGVGTTDSNNFAIDTLRPTATIVVEDTSLAVGETSLVTITFSEAVSGFSNADLTVANGTLSAVSSSDGGITWTATFTPTSNITDATNLITLDNSGVTDAAGNAGSGTTTSNNYAIDTLRPTATIVVADTALKVGETSLVTITFSEAVSGFSNADLTVANGTLSAVSSSDGGITWTATFTPTSNITDATNLITLDNSGVTDAAGNAGSGTTTSNNYAIDTLRPTATIVVADTALKVGETSLVTITFSEAVSGFSNADLTVANGTLSAVSSSDGGITWTATFTPTSNITDATNLITLDNSGVTDAAGNAGSGTTDSNNYAIDTQRPTATIVVADTALKVGETSLVIITFSEAVSGFTNADLTIANGTLSAVSSADGGITWTATLTPTASITDTTNVITLDNTGYVDAAGNSGTGTTDSNNYAIDTQRPTATIVVADTALAVGEASLVTITFSEAVTGLDLFDFSVEHGALSNLTSSDGGLTWTATLTPTASITDTTNVITLDNTGYVDAAGNSGTGTTDSNNYAIDTQRPTATIVVSDTALTVGESSTVTITFSEAVTGLDLGDFTVANGVLSDLSSSDGITWKATLTPTAGNTSAGNLITLDNSGVQDAAGNTGANVTTSNAYAIDTQRPTATIVVNDTALAVGESSTVIITFSEAVTGLDVGDFTVANGSLSNLMSSDGGLTWTATLTPTAGITDTTNVVTLSNTGYVDTAGNSGTATTASNVYAIDTLAPVVPGITLDQATLVNGRQVSPTGLVFISGLEAGGSWQYSLDNGVSWIEGRGNSLKVPGLGAFSLWVQQKDMAGNASSVTSLSGIVEPLVPPAVHAPFAFAVSSSSDGLGLTPFQPSEVPEPNADFLHSASMMLSSVSQDKGMPRQDSWSEYGLPQSIAGVNDWMWASLFAPVEPNRSGFDPAPEQFSVTTGASILDLKPVLLASESPWDIESLQFSFAGKQELPGWVRLDRHSGQLTINAPKDLSTMLVLQIKVSDGKGHESVRTVKLVVGDARATSSVPTGRAGLSEKMANAASQQAGTRVSQYVHG